MTATMSSNSNVDRITPRPVGRRSSRVPADVDYGIRRAVAAVIAVLLVAVVAIAVSTLGSALADVGGRPAAASDAAAASASPIVRIHVAQPGDTLWSIADRYRGDVGQGRFVDALIDLNGGTVIQVGQAIRLP
jgi:Tfp pilus assembly protein FimV